MQIKLGEQMRELRRRNGITQEDLARALGVTAQAVSRWEKGVCYPDMELIPSMANYFSVSIDGLFGYQGEREKKIDELAEKITQMNRRNNGVDECVDECIRLAREGLVEFPGNEMLMLCLASVLYNAGYVRKGEHHLTDADGYDIFDVERHRGYEEWQEAIKLYEKLLETVEPGDIRNQAVRELVQLYVNTGEHEKARAVAAKAPGIGECRELLLLCSSDGKKRAEAFSDALLRLTEICSHLMVSCVMMRNSHIESKDAAEAVRGAISLYKLVCTDENYGVYEGELASLNLYLSEHLWRAGDKDGAFGALYQALEHARKFDVTYAGEYTSPLVSGVKFELKRDSTEPSAAKSLPEDWPWWFVPDCSDVKAEMTADPRWDEWVKATQN